MDTPYYLSLFTNYLIVEKNLSEKTVSAYQEDIRDFLAYLEKSGMELAQISILTIRKYLAFLYGKGLKRNSISRKMSALRAFFSCLTVKKILNKSPIVKLTLPKSEHRLPTFLYEDEIVTLLEIPDVSTLYGLRDRAIMEVLYASGIRVSELVSLNLKSIRWEQSMLKIHGKRDKERIVIINQTAQYYLYDYINKSRLPDTCREEQAVFLNNRGTRLSERSVRNIVKKYINKAAIHKNVSPHTFRHTFATHMLDNGADLRSVQELLGHVELSTTQIYTHFTKSKVKKIYEKTHPRA